MMASFFSPAKSRFHSCTRPEWFICYTSASQASARTPRLGLPIFPLLGTLLKANLEGQRLSHLLIPTFGLILPCRHTTWWFDTGPGYALVAHFSAHALDMYTHEFDPPVPPSLSDSDPGRRPRPLRRRPVLTRLPPPPAPSPSVSLTPPPMDILCWDSPAAAAAAAAASAPIVPAPAPEEALLAVLLGARWLLAFDISLAMMSTLLRTSRASSAAGPMPTDDNREADAAAAAPAGAVASAEERMECVGTPGHDGLGRFRR